MSDITNKTLPDLGTIKKALKQSNACKWNVNEPGIKVFFDVTGIGEMARLGASKSTFGVGISLTAMFTNKVLHSVNHVGFILSDGTIIHATTNRGVIRESGKDIINNPTNYVVVNVGGNESDLISKYNQLKKTLYIDKDSYDWKGIIRQFPIIGKLLGRLNFARENKPYRFYCSELVANLLVRCGVISYNELVSLHEKTVGLDKYDEVDPTKLFLMIKSKAELCPVVCDTNKDLKKENIMTKQELKQLIREVIKEANTKELQKLGFTPIKSYIKEVKGYVLGPMDQASTWIAWNKKPKNKNGKQMYVVSAAEFQKQFPSIQMKELPAKPSYGADYYIIDGEGDLFPYSQANIGSGLD